MALEWVVELILLFLYKNCSHSLGGRNLALEWVVELIFLFLY